MLSPTQAKILRFFIAGTTSAVVNLSLLYLCVEYLHLHYIIAAICSYLGSLAFGFTLQKFWSFQDHRLNCIHFQLVEYVAVTVFNMSLNTGLMYLFVGVLGLWYILAQIISAALLAIISYSAYNGFIFTAKPVPSIPPSSR
ncbi:MAG TPA: GtrA family protein [Candidatus Paceibacterota bacterium]